MYLKVWIKKLERDGLRLSLFQVAETVCRPVYELEVDMPLSEVLEWRAYWKWKAAAEKKATEKAQREAKSKSGRRW